MKNLNLIATSLVAVISLINGYQPPNAYANGPLYPLSSMDPTPGGSIHSAGMGKVVFDGEGAS